MREIKNENKKSKLIFDPKMARKLLKLNGEIKYCPYCGKALNEHCECHKNIIVDCKPLRGGNGESVMVFDNNDAFQKDMLMLMEEMKAKKEKDTEEKLAADVD